jgi:hypothetical protein
MPTRRPAWTPPRASRYSAFELVRHGLRRSAWPRAWREHEMRPRYDVVVVGVGELVAGELLGEPSTLLEPFRFARYRTGKLHPVSNSPFPGADRRVSPRGPGAP